MSKYAYIVDAVRTPTGRRKGGLAHVHGADLGAHVLKALVERNPSIPDADYEDVIFGCCDTVGTLAGDIARTCWLAAGLDQGVPGTTIDRQCGSSQQAVHFAAQAVMSGTQDVVVAGGVQTMTQIPISYAMTAAEPLGIKDPFSGSKGWVDRYGDQPPTQFNSAQMIADKWEISRKELEEFSLESHKRALKAIEEGRFDNEVITVQAPILDDEGNPTGEMRTVARDQGLRATTMEGLEGLKPVFEGGVHTAGTSSQISDGAAAVLMMSAEEAKARGLKPRARVVTSTVTGTDPYYLLDGPVDATRVMFEKTGMNMRDIDLFEVNEAFASVVLSWARVYDADMSKVNVNGGAMALGHPVGSTGARMLATALNELERQDKSRALLTMCCGASIGTGLIIERI